MADWQGPKRHCCRDRRPCKNRHARVSCNGVRFVDCRSRRLRHYPSHRQNIFAPAAKSAETQDRSHCLHPSCGCDGFRRIRNSRFINLHRTWSFHGQGRRPPRPADGIPDDSRDFILCGVNARKPPETGIDISYINFRRKLEKGDLEMAEMLVVRSKVKEYAAKKKMRTGSDAMDVLNKEVMRLIDKAVERAKYRKEGTLKARHI